MTASLWTWDDLVAASGGVADGSPAHAITGFSIDTRSLSKGDVFVALKDARDGHEFVSAAFAAGAAAAIVASTYVRRAGDGALLHVDDSLQGLENIARASRARLHPAARVVAITGSAGKTSTTAMLRACLALIGPTHAPEKSFNNHWGVPLTLARMPASTRFAAIEIGMNHAGEITPLTRLTRPHIAIVTTVAPVHLEHFQSVDDIAAAKAEIFAGLEPDGTAILPGYNAHFQRLADAAESSGARILTFGGVRIAANARRAAELDINLTSAEWSDDALGHQTVWAHTRDGDNIRFDLAMRGDHMAINALAVALALSAAGVDRTTALGGLTNLSSGAGRGERSRRTVPGGEILLIDESYNANPSSMRATILTAAAAKDATFKRLVLVLGDMLELGPDSANWHAGLVSTIKRSGDGPIFTCGPMMRHLHDALPAELGGAWAATSSDLIPHVLQALRPGDVVMVKGSLGTRMAPIVDAIKKHFAASQTGG